jgi:hypothetical protein
VRKFDPARQSLDARAVTRAVERYKSARLTSTRQPALTEIADLVEATRARAAHVFAATMTAANCTFYRLGHTQLATGENAR